MQKQDYETLKIFLFVTVQQYCDCVKIQAHIYDFRVKAFPVMDAHARSVTRVDKYSTVEHASDMDIRVKASGRSRFVDNF